MGAYSPAPIINKIIEKKIISKIVYPTLQALKKRGKPYSGFLYVGLMIKNNEPYLIEYNVRMGDPECQTILPKLKTDFLSIIEKCINQKLNDLSIDWYNDKSICIVLCSKGYPDDYENNIKINLEKISLDRNQFIFHAGTKISDNNIVSNGGRVLNIVTKSNDLRSARENSLKLLKKINWDNGFFRKDIGYKVIG